MENKRFYKKYLNRDEDCLRVSTVVYVCVKETPCYYMCVPEWFHSMKNEMYDIDYARKIKQLKRIAKRGSRIAFETHKEAFAHLKFLKRKQLIHIIRTADDINAFIEEWDNLNFETSNDIKVRDGSDVVDMYSLLNTEKVN